MRIGGMDEPDTTVKVILPAGRIPLNATVTKRNGRKVYVLKDKLRVFPVPESKSAREAREARGEDREGFQEIKAEAGIRFLVEEGDANAVLATTELVWHTDVDGLRYWLDSGYGVWMDGDK